MNLHRFVDFPVQTRRGHRAAHGYNGVSLVRWQCALPVRTLPNEVGPCTQANETRIAAGARRRGNPRPVASTLGLVTEHGAGRN
jgi:hypothetical protein